MNNTATFIIDSATVLTGADRPNDLQEAEDLVALQIVSGEAALNVSLASEKAEAIAEALLGQQITGTIREVEQPQTGPDGKEYYMKAFSRAANDAVVEEVQRAKAEGEQA